MFVIGRILVFGANCILGGDIFICIPVSSARNKGRGIMDAYLETRSTTVS